MKFLILILLAGAYAEAQTLADVARGERDRQSSITSVRVFTNENTLGIAASTNTTTILGPAASAAELPSDTTGAPSGESEPPSSSPAPGLASPVPAVSADDDPVQQWNEEINQIRNRVSELEDQETALQLQLNVLTNQFTAPVSNENIRRQVQGRLGETQRQLNSVRDELEQTRETLRLMEAQGPPGR